MCRRVAGELGVRLVDDDHAGRGRADGVDRGERQRRAGRVVRRGDEHQVGLLGLDRGDALIRVQPEVGPPAGGDPAGPGGLRDQRVHGVRRLEAERAAAGAAEGEQDLLQHLVGPVRGPRVRAGQAVPEVAGEGGAQHNRVPVRIAVQPGRHVRDRRGDVGGQRRRRRVRVLVRVQLDRHGQLRRAVRTAAGQVRPDGQGQLSGFCRHVASSVVSLTGAVSSVSLDAARSSWAPGPGRGLVSGPGPPARARPGPPRRRARRCAAPPRRAPARRTQPGARSAGTTAPTGRRSSARCRRWAARGSSPPGSRRVTPAPRLRRRSRRRCAPGGPGWRHRPPGSPGARAPRRRTRPAPSPRRRPAHTPTDRSAPS